MTGADMTGAAALHVAFTRCLLVSAQLPGLSFFRARLDGVSFADADLRRADFREAVLSDCSLADANLTDARFQGADLRGADLGRLRLVDAARFKGAIISRQQAADLLGTLGLKVL